MELAKIDVDDFGGSPFAEHNMPCAICGVKHAMLELNYGRFQPCCGCQSEGWHAIKIRGWRAWVLKMLGVLKWYQYGRIGKKLLG